MGASSRGRASEAGCRLANGEGRPPGQGIVTGTAETRRGSGSRRRLEPGLAAGERTPNFLPERQEDSRFQGINGRKAIVLILPVL